MWQSMETAPKDKTILIYGLPTPLLINGDILVEYHKAAVYTAMWDEMDEAFVLSGGSWLGPFVYPTKWMLCPTINEHNVND